ncbi:MULTISPECIES: ATP-binding protein [Thermoactinomyces]|jgi:DNA helicase HerA-like ATPase|uniref:ATP-binding protein n=1 Tax=Thermoactinomyces daqus TaxID=1329516 RepID=A0A7W2AHA1_9BACL|nr:MULTISPECIES: ATP-binding protein [Thermoactinomyces]MBA4542461.1 ATP-binding protein [Thermoactinomyces daqus]MBH8598750.1 ATP-binding protein [Thermoactinomyces sp. CICC 10523]MBH8607439.1 ATP-binding protein [Thermoactinomyces sp. CICC 10521]
MQVVGVTTQQEVYIVSRERKFRINEILVIEDNALNNPRGEVVETLSYNRLIPMGLDKSLVDAQVIRSLEQIGYDIESDEINLAKLRLYEEAPHPVRTGCSVRLPEFAEVRDLLVKTTPSEGMLLGEIRGTESMSETITPDLRNRVMIMEQGALREQRGVPFIFDIKTMQQYPHVGIFGGSGSGKSFGLRVMLEELMKLRIPTLVFDPHFEMDFRDRVPGVEGGDDFTDRFIAVQIGQEVGISFSDLSTRDVTELLGAAGSQLSDAMVNVIQMLHRKRDSFASFSDRINNLVQALEEGKQGLERQLNNADLTPTDVQRIHDLKQLLAQYGTLPLSSVKGVHWRLQRLDRAGLFQQDIRAIERGLEQGKLVVIQGSTWVLQVFATYVIGSLYRKRREYKDARMNGEEAKFFPPFIVVTDEAHNFAPKALESPAKAILKEIAQEGRKYGVFLFLATQRPTLLDETITAQLNTKFVFRTVRGTDIATLREETDLTPEEGKRLPYLRSGDTFVSSAVFGRTIFIRIRCAYTQSPHLSNPFDELKQFAEKQDDQLLGVLAGLLPLFDTDLVGAVAQINRACGLSWDVHRLKQELERLTLEGKLSKHATPFAVRYDKR